jgi:hypothetical protein
LKDAFACLTAEGEDFLRFFCGFFAFRSFFQDSPCGNPPALHYNTNQLGGMAMVVLPVSTVMSNLRSSVGELRDSL